MSNVKLVFSGTTNSETEEHELTAYANTNNEIYIAVGSNHDSPYFKGFICLDKSTAIKLHRELKKQISFLTNEDV